MNGADISNALIMATAIGAIIYVTVSFSRHRPNLEPNHSFAGLRVDEVMGIIGTRRVDVEETSALSSLLRQIARQRRSGDPHSAIKAARVARILAKLVEVQGNRRERPTFSDGFGSRIIRL